MRELWGVFILSFLSVSFVSDNKAVIPTVVLGDQEWMVKNLEVTYFRNGELIPEAKTADEWEKAGELGKPAWCYYNNEMINGIRYGKLYNWYAVVDPRGICPQGFHIPTDVEWNEITNLHGGLELAGDKLKNNQGWKESGNGTNSSGFTAVPGGARFEDGKFNYAGTVCYFWSSTSDGTNVAWNRSLKSAFSGFYRTHHLKQDGFSCRCLKD